jgi:hypothetical protein
MMKNMLYRPQLVWEKGRNKKSLILSQFCIIYEYFCDCSAYALLSQIHFHA